MHITLEADYAVRIVVFVAEQNKRVDASTISENTGVSLRFALKILRNLVGTDIVKSFKGVQGGYEINRDPSTITLKELLECVEGEYTFSRCTNSSGKIICTMPVRKSCKTQIVFENITKTVRDILNNTMVSDLMSS